MCIYIYVHTHIHVCIWVLRPASARTHIHVCIWVLRPASLRFFVLFMFNSTKMEAETVTWGCSQGGHTNLPPPVHILRLFVLPHSSTVLLNQDVPCSNLVVDFEITAVARHLINTYMWCYIWYIYIPTYIVVHICILHIEILVHRIERKGYPIRWNVLFLESSIRKLEWIPTLPCARELEISAEARLRPPWCGLYQNRCTYISKNVYTIYVYTIYIHT